MFIVVLPPLDHALYGELMGLEGLVGGRVGREVHLVAALQVGQRGAQDAADPVRPLGAAL